MFGTHKVYHHTIAVTTAHSAGLTAFPLDLGTSSKLIRQNVDLKGYKSSLNHAFRNEGLGGAVPIVPTQITWLSKRVFCCCYPGHFKTGLKLSSEGKS